MFPYVMPRPKYQYPTLDPVIVVKRLDTLMPIDDVFNVMQGLIKAPNNLYFPLSPEREPNGTVMYALKTISHMWCSVRFKRLLREYDKAVYKSQNRS